MLLIAVQKTHYIPFKQVGVYTSMFWVATL